MSLGYKSPRKPEKVRLATKHEVGERQRFDSVVVGRRRPLLGQEFDDVIAEGVEESDEAENEDETLRDFRSLLTEVPESLTHRVQSEGRFVLPCRSMLRSYNMRIGEREGVCYGGGAMFNFVEDLISYSQYNVL